MKTVIQPLAGNTNFDGTADRGLITFTDLALPNMSEDQVPILVGVGLETNGVPVGTIDCFLKVAVDGAATFNRITVRTLADQNGFVLHGCYVPVPRQVLSAPTVFTPWDLILITTGKTAQANFIASYQLGPALPPS